MESKQQTVFICLLFFLLKFYISSATSEPEIISTQHEIITYLNHTAKFSCLIKNRNQKHVTWSRVNFINDTQKLANLLYVDQLKYTPLNRYHLSHSIDSNKNEEHWDLEIRQVHLADQGYYSCVLTAIKPISKIFYLKVIDNSRNVPFALRSTAESSSSSSLKRISVSSIVLFLFAVLDL